RDFFNTQFVEVIDKGFDGLLNLGGLELGYVAGSMLIVPLAEASLQEDYHMQLGRELRAYENGELLNKMLSIAQDQSYPQNLRSTITDAIALMNKLLQQQTMKSQTFHQSSLGTDQYYAIPLMIFVSGEEMKKYFR